MGDCAGSSIQHPDRNPAKSCKWRRTAFAALCYFHVGPGLAVPESEQSGSCWLSPPLQPEASLQPWFYLPCPLLLAQGRVAVMPELSLSGRSTWQGEDTRKHSHAHKCTNTNSPSCTFGHLPKCQHHTAAPFPSCPSVLAVQPRPTQGWQHSHTGIPHSRAWTHRRIALGGGTAQHGLMQRVVLPEHWPPAPKS